FWIRKAWGWRRRRRWWWRRWRRRWWRWPLQWRLRWSPPLSLTLPQRTSSATVIPLTVEIIFPTSLQPVLRCWCQLDLAVMENLSCS
ncbi:hypothetical protein Hamer_G017430, partial [Homarus americanus]